MYLTQDQLDEPEVQELLAERRMNRLHQLRLMAHPNCRDPDHPGCDQCMGDGRGDE